MVIPLAELTSSVLESHHRIARPDQIQIQSVSKYRRLIMSILCATVLISSSMLFVEVPSSRGAFICVLGAIAALSREFVPKQATAKSSTGSPA